MQHDSTIPSHMQDKELFAEAKTLKDVFGPMAGFVSMCWIPKPTGEFDSGLATMALNMAMKRGRELIIEQVTAHLAKRFEDSGMARDAMEGFELE